MPIQVFPLSFPQPLSRLAQIGKLLWPHQLQTQALPLLVLPELLEPELFEPLELLELELLELELLELEELELEELELLEELEDGVLDLQLPLEVFIPLLAPAICGIKSGTQPASSIEYE